MELEMTISIATFIATLICGFIAKKIPKFSNKLIPVQNILIGLIVAGVEFATTKNFSTAIAVSGLIAGGTYDVFHNLNKLIEKEGE